MCGIEARNRDVPNNERKRILNDNRLPSPSSMSPHSPVALSGWHYVDRTHILCRDCEVWNDQKNQFFFSLFFNFVNPSLYTIYAKKYQQITYLKKKWKSGMREWMRWTSGTCWTKMQKHIEMMVGTCKLKNLWKKKVLRWMRVAVAGSHWRQWYRLFYVLSFGSIFSFWLFVSSHQDMVWYSSHIAFL